MNGFIDMRKGVLVVLTAFLSACGGGGGGGGGAGVAANDTTALTVVSTTPPNGATGVALNTTVSATASKALSSATLNATTFTLVAVGGGPVAGTISVTGNTATFTPVSALTDTTQYIATIRSGAGLAADFVWSFTTVTVPGAPIIGAAAATGVVTSPGVSGQATVAFAPPVNVGGTPITGYTVTSNPGGIVQPGVTSPITVNGLNDGTSYTFTVTATNSIGVGPPSAPSNSITPGVAAVPPGAPTFGAPAPPSAPGNGQATVSFNAPGSSGSSPIVNYTVTALSGGVPTGITASGGGTSIVVPGLTNGIAYTFSVVAFNVAGPSLPSAPSAAVTPAGLPGAPTSASAVAGALPIGASGPVGTATVTFSAPASNGGSAITGYMVTSNPGGGVDSNAGSPALSHAITGLTVGTPYTFTVTAANVVGVGPPSLPSGSVTPTPLTTAPSAPATPNALAGNAQATVSFTPLLTAPANGGSPVISYTVTALIGGIPTAITATGGTSPIVVSGLTNGTAYGFTVKATNSVGAGPASAASNPVTPVGPPGAPTIGTATGGIGQATVTFTPPASNGGSPIINYTVTPNPGGVPLSASGLGSPITVTGLTSGVSYTFTVTATTALFNGPPSAASNTVTPSAATAPTAPTITSAVQTTPPAFTGVSNSGTATVTFSVPASDGGSPITGYTVTSNPAGAIDADAGTTALSHSISGLTLGTAYLFQVRATNAVGASPPSVASSPVTPATKPGTPTAVSAIAGDQQATVGFTPPSNGGSAITLYTVTSAPSGIQAFGIASPITVPSPLLANGTVYTFTVTATNAIGAGLAGTSNPVTPNAQTAPPAPAITSAVQTTPPAFTGVSNSGTATVTFTAPTCVPPPFPGTCPAISGYTVTSNPPGGVDTNAGTTGLSHAINNLVIGTAYTFTVTATNAVGNSPPSGASGTVIPITVPDKPTIGTATAGNGQATVSFTPPANNGGSAIIANGFTVTASAPGGTASGSSSPIVVASLNNGTAYTFTVTATNAAGTSLPSAASNSVTPNLTTVVPPAPTVSSAVQTTPPAFTGVSNSGTATVTFTAPTCNLPNCPAISGYTVTSNPPGGVDTNAGTTGLSHAINNLVIGTAYTFTVTATNAVGNSPPSGASGTVIPITVPDKPTIGTATTGNGQATVSFTPPANNGGSAIIANGFTVTASAPGGTASGSSSPIVVASLNNGTAYTFTVTATNAAGTSLPSAASNSVTPTSAIVPTQPLGPITATAGAGGTATVTFNAPACALTTCAPITGYTVTSSPPGGTDLNAGGTGLSHSINGLTIGTAYTFTVTAANALGTSPPSAASNSVTPTGPPGQPAAPVATATGVSNQVSVAFTAPASNGSPITSYTVSAFASDGVTPVSVLPAPTGAASPIVVTSVSLVNGTSYRFKVTANNANGAGPASPVSNLATPTAAPLACPVVGPPAAAATASRTTGVAPLAVFFDASGTSSAATARPFHEIEYRWNFGDGSSGNWFPSDGSGARITFLTRSGGIATAVTATAHGFSSGDRVRVRGANEVGYTGEVVVTVVDSTTFQYPVPVGTITPATGTIFAAGQATGPSRNTAAGPVATHVFEAPGTYAVVVTANDGTSAASCSISISVQDPATVFAGANTTCVSSTALPVAGAGGCPAAANVQLQANFPTIVNTLALSGKRILLKGGDVFTGPATAQLAANGPGIIGSYGTGHAIIRTTDSTNFTNILTINGAGVNDWRLMDLEFDGQHDLHRAAIFGAGRFDQLTMLRLNMHDLGGGIEIPPESATAPLHDQLALADSVALRLDKGGIASATSFSHGILAAAHRLSIIGNLFDNSQVNLGSDHMIRIPFADRGVVSNNQITRVNAGQEMVALRAPTSTNAPGNSGFFGTGGSPDLGLNGAAATTQKVVVSGNLIMTNVFAGVKIGQVDPTHDTTLIQNIIVERNYHQTQPGGESAIVIHANDVTVRDELVDLSGAPTAQDPTGVTVVAASALMAASTNVVVYNNSIYSSTDMGFGQGILFQAGTTGAAINNLGYAPASPGVQMINNSSGAGVLATNNSSNAQMRGGAPSPFTTTPPTTAAHFKPLPGGYAVLPGAATSVKVWSDYFFVCTFGSPSCATPGPLNLGAVIP